MWKKEGGLEADGRHALRNQRAGQVMLLGGMVG